VRAREALEARVAGDAEGVRLGTRRDERGVRGSEDMTRARAKEDAPERDTISMAKFLKFGEHAVGHAWYTCAHASALPNLMHG
jgi:hypothetical protein